MKNYFFLILLCLPCVIFAQDRPSYCEEIPKMYAKGAAPKSLPKFATKPTKEYKVQVAILRNTDPSEYPFHKSLVARYRPCEQVWVVESRKSFKGRKEAEKLRDDLKKLGYYGAYITEIVGFE